MEGKTKRKQTDSPKGSKIVSPAMNKSAKTTTGDLAGKPAASSSEYRTDPQFIMSLVNTPCDQLRVPANTVFVAERTDKLIDVFKGLVRHNFLSVPILQKTGRKWYGFIDMADIVSYIVDIFGANKLQTTQDYWALFEKEESLRNKTVNDVAKYPLNRRNPFHPVKSGYSLFFVIEALARERDLHRIPVVDDERQLLNLITQSQVVRFLFENLGKMGDKIKKPVRMMDCALKDVIMISESQPAIEAFSKMTTENISGIAVVDETHKLTGTLSLRDLKAIAPDATLFWRLYQPTREFISRLNSEYGESRPRTPQFCTPDDTLESVITKLAEHKIHRLFVVDNLKVPVGVISLKDILMQLMA